MPDALLVIRAIGLTGRVHRLMQVAGQGDGSENTRESMMRANLGCMVAVLVGLAACSGKHRSFTDARPADPESSGDGAVTTSGQQPAATGPGNGSESVVGGGEPGGGVPASIEGVQQSGGVTGGPGGNSCEGDAGACTPPDAGPEPSVCAPGPRDCGSSLDNDCDGQPDDVVDDVCRCVTGTTEPCDEHPGLDGRGQCLAGSLACILGEGNLTSDWSACVGAVGPGAQDSCATPGDDTDCDGVPNEGCSCLDGQTQVCGPNTDNGICQRGTSICENGAFGPCQGAVFPLARDSCAVQGDDSNCNGVPNDGCACINGQTRACGPNTDNGICQRGTQTCVNGAFGQCVGAVFATGRNCASQQDNDCDGRPDNAIDNVCTCSVGAMQACGTHPGLDGVGQCRAGQRRCDASPNSSSSAFGVCTGSVGPAPLDSCTNVNDGNCDGIANGGCDCVTSQGDTGCSDEPDNARCNGSGQCVPCQSDANCSLISGGRDTCTAGRCVQGDTTGPSIPSTNVIASVVDDDSFNLRIFSATDNVTARGDIEYAVFYANPRETNVLSGAISPSAILTLASQGEVATGRAFAVLPAGNENLVIQLAEPLPIVEARVIARDEAGNMSTYPPARAVF